MGRSSISMGHGFHGELLNNQSAGFKMETRGHHLVRMSGEPLVRLSRCPINSPMSSVSPRKLDTMGHPD